MTYDSVQKCTIATEQNMPRSCTVCQNVDCSAIDTALVENQPLRSIARRFGTTAASLHRHRRHLPLKLTKAKQAEEVARATTILDRIESLIGRLETIAEQAQQHRAWSAATGAIREMRGCLTLLAQMNGELGSGMYTGIDFTLAIRQIRVAAKEASADQIGELLQLVRDLLDNANDDQFATLAQTFGVALPPLDEPVSERGHDTQT
jgi:hypothetical protein